MDRKAHGRQRLLSAGAVLAIGAWVAGLGGCTRATDETNGRITILDGCRAHSRTPEVHSFYGTLKELEKKLSDFESHVDLQLGDRNAQMYMVERAETAEIVLYRRVDDKADWQSWRWSGSRADAKAKEEQANRILAEREDKPAEQMSEEEKKDFCLGAKTQKLFEGWELVRKKEKAKLPATALQGFADVIRDIVETKEAPGEAQKDGPYMRATLSVLC